METTTTAAATAAQMPQENIFVSLLPFAFIFVVFYFLIIRPQQKRMKQHQAMVTGIQKGDKVVLSSGIIGKVTKTGDTDGIIEVEIANGVNVKVVASTVSTVESRSTISNDNKKAA